MESERSLDLDVETIGYGQRSQRVARLAVVGVEGCTRDGSAATITADCATAEDLEREVERLRRELGDALARGVAALSGDAAPRDGAASRPRERAASAPARAERGLRLQLPASATVADVMTREVVTVDVNDSLANAKASMEAGRFRHLVAVNEAQGIEGVLSQRDLFFGPLAWSLGQGSAGYEKLLGSTLVKDAMQVEVETIPGSASLQVAAARLVERQVGCLPVVEANRLVGLLTESDLAMLIARAAAVGPQRDADEPRPAG